MACDTVANFLITCNILSFDSPQFLLFFYCIFHCVSTIYPQFLPFFYCVSTVFRFCFYYLSTVFLLFFCCVSTGFPMCFYRISDKRVINDSYYRKLRIQSYVCFYWFSPVFQSGEYSCCAIGSKDRSVSVWVSVLFRGQSGVVFVFGGIDCLWRIDCIWRIDCCW